MTIIELTKGLKEIEATLEEFVSPDNKNGFYRVFVSWVVKKWETGKYFSDDVRDVGFDVSTYPKSTSQALKDVAKTYAEFINSNTGLTVATHCSGMGIACENFDAALYEVFGDACQELIDSEIDRLGLVVPDEYKGDADDLSEFIWGEVADYKTHPDLYDVSTSIACRFGRIGYELEPYLCESCGDVDSTDWSDHRFANLTLAEFKLMAFN